MQKRAEARHGKTAKAMASRTKDNLQFYTKEKLNNFVAKEKEREEKQREKEERKYQKRLEKERLAAEGKKRHRRTKYEIAKDKGLSVVPPKASVGVTVEMKKKKPQPANSKQPSKPVLDFNALIRMAQEKQNKPDQTNGKDSKAAKGPQPKRPMTQEEKERWERTHTKEYQEFLKRGGKRPEFPGVKRVKESTDDNSSRESSPEPKGIKGGDVSKKQILKGSGKTNQVETKGSENKSLAGKRTYLNGDLRAGTSNAFNKSKPKKQEQSSNGDIPSSPEPEVNETVIQCGPTKDKVAMKRKSEATRVNPFDRIIQRYDAHRPPPGRLLFFVLFWRWRWRWQCHLCTPLLATGLNIETSHLV